ncbi:MAG: GAF domain-containing protein [Anaerolineae bacterium]|jgi:GAF domain-containing protein|nr:GAF domain-containing protein [Anaerolineae bacterium]
MINKLLEFFRSEDDENPTFIRLTRNILLFVIFATASVLMLVTGILGGNSRNVVAFIALLSSLAIELLAFVRVRQNKILMAKIVVPIALIVAISFIAYGSNGIRSTAFFAIPAILVVGAILLGGRSLFIIMPLAVIASIITSSIDIMTSREVQTIGIDDAIIFPILILTTAGITHLLITRLNESIDRAKKSEQAQKLENIELMELRETLEDRVKERTTELELANQVNERRARQFRAVTQVMNIISSIQSLDALLPRITQVVSEQFNVYHSGIFLLDKTNEYAVLRAANSEGGQRMLERQHKLLVGQTGIVGFVTATGQPRIALDVGTDSVFFDNPDLPNTRSEIALPLRYAGQTIGALDVQSVEPNAFSQEDIEVLTTLANQVAVAINNALTIEEAQKSLSEAQSAIGEIAQEAWQVLRPAKLGLGFAYTESGVTPLETPINDAEVSEALHSGKTVLATKDDQNSSMVVPIRLRGQIVGFMKLNTHSQVKLTDDEADIAEAIAERLSLAIETATLLQSTQQRAEIERVTAKISSSVSSSTRFEVILQTAAQELSRALGGSDVLVQIEPAALKMQS